MTYKSKPDQQQVWLYGYFYSGHQVPTNSKWFVRQLKKETGKYIY